MLKIRLMRTGKKNQPFYRVVVQEAGNKVQGAVKDTLGTYDAIKGGNARINQERLKLWLARGAKVSPTAAALIKKAAKAA